MGFFTKAKRGRPRKKPKVLKEILNDAWLNTLKKDPELLREVSAREAGHAEILERDKEVEAQRKQIKKFVTSEALKKIQSDPVLAEQFIESQVEDILSEGKPSRGRHRGESESYYESGSSISQALEEVESLSELREKLQELGMVEGGQGFFKGISMKNILEALPFVAALMGRGEESIKPIKTYLVKIDGQNQEILESQYKILLQEGKLQPVAALEQPKPKLVGEPEAPEEPAEIPELPEFLQGIDFTIAEGWFEQEPQDFVVNLKAEADAGLEESRLAWGFFTTATYEGIVEKITPFRTHPEVGNLVERVLSEEGKVWLTRVLELVKETLNE